MRLTLYQVDAFASQVFHGNPAAVCPLSQWLEDAVLQAIAAENNLSETAFFVPTAHGYHLRWYTPVTEVDLCGHATLAAASVIFTQLGYAQPRIYFETRSGVLTVTQEQGLLVMDFPSSPPAPCAAPAALLAGLGHAPLEVWAADDYLAVYASEAEIRAIAPDYAQLRLLDKRGVIVTAPGESVDFVSRFFAPKFGIPEDPVTGSAHCSLMPYWAARLGKRRCHARQVSIRGGDVYCELLETRVTLAGKAVLFMAGEIFI